MLAWYFDEAGASDLFFVRGYLLGWGAGARQVEEAGGFVGTGADNFCAVLANIRFRCISEKVCELTFDQQQLNTGPS